MVPASVQSAFRALGDDNYTSPPLPPDTYVVDVTWVAPNSAPTSAALMSSTWRYPRARFNGELGDTDVDAGTITTWSEAVPISGRVFVNGVTPAPRLEDLTFNVTSLEPVGDFVSLKIATDGTFKIPELALGQYVVEPQLPSDLYVTSARFAGRETLDTFFTVEKDSTGPLELTVASGASSITGTVRTAGGDPVTLGTVVLVPALRLRGNPALFRRAVTDSTATFTLRGIPPGDYTLIAWDWVRLYSYYNPEILREVEGRGQKITVASGSRQNVSLRAIEYSSN
jgi:hypothetical protein